MSDFAGRSHRVADFQNAGPGNPFRDVIYCMTTMLSVEERRQWEKELVLYYLEELRRQGGPSIREEDAWNDIRIHSMTALAFWTLTVAPGEDVRMNKKHEAIN